MQLNFIIRTNYFKVSRTVRHNVMAKETVLVPRGLQLDQKGTRRRKTDYARENIISFGIRILPLLPFIRVITGTDFLANTTAQPGIEYQCVEDRGY